MGVLVLNKLNKELTRLCIAGSSLGKEDSRIEKYIPILENMGEKAPIFKTLVLKLENILDVKDASESLIEALTILYSVLHIQGSTNTNNYNESMVFQNTSIQCSKLTRSNIEDIQNELLYNPNGQGKEIKEIYEHNLHNDTRLYKLYCNNITENKSVISNLLENEIIPSIGKDIAPFIKEKLNINGTKKDARLFKVLYKVLGKDILSLALKVIEEGSETVRAQAIYALWEYKDYEGLLLSYAKKGKGSVKTASFTALIKMKSQRGESLFENEIKKTNIGHLCEALEVTESKNIVNVVIDEVRKEMNNYEKKSRKINKLLRVLIKRNDLEVINYIGLLVTDLDFYRKISDKIDLSNLLKELEGYDTTENVKIF